MSKLRADYELTKGRRFQRWVNGETLPFEKFEKEIQEEMQHAKEVSEQRAKEKEQEVLEQYIETANMLEKYKDWPETKGIKIFQTVYRFMSVIICTAIIGVLLLTVYYLPLFGDPNNPVNNEVPERYIEQGLQETGAVNIVTGMILDYRAFDTFGESHVLFIGACAVIILLRIDHDKDGKPSDAQLEAEENDRIYEPKNDVILQKIAFILVPPIIIFGIYVILNGHLSPGGGFSGGAIVGAGLILYLNAFGFKKTERFFTRKTFTWCTFTSLVFYACAKGYSFFMGANHLESGIPLGTPGNILSSGLILPLNICVGIVVACTMYGLYALFRKGDM